MTNKKLDDLIDNHIKKAVWVVVGGIALVMIAFTWRMIGGWYDDHIIAKETARYWSNMAKQVGKEQVIIQRHEWAERK